MHRAIHLQSDYAVVFMLRTHPDPNSGCKQKPKAELEQSKHETASSASDCSLRGF